MNLLKEISKALNLPIEELSFRGDGRVEWICEHGVGHTVYNPNDWGEYDFVHNCDGCCFGIEIFKPVKDFSKYIICSNGNLINTAIGITMKPHYKKEYLHVQLNQDNRRKYKSVHRIVAEAFIPNPENKRCVHHKDHNTQNNHVSNLEWVTDSENLKYCYDAGRRPNQKEILRENARKLSKGEIMEIRNLLKEGYKNVYISKKYNVHRETISRIKRNLTYKNVQ
jgi:hypothetical protein